jgi:FlaG/FlaF family flagellin (archaellin)
MSRTKRVMLAIAVPVVALAAYLFLVTGGSGSEASSAPSAIAEPASVDSGSSTGAADEYDHLVLPTTQR